MNVLADVFGTAIDYMVEQACKDLNLDVPKWQKLLKAYNRMEAEEHDYADYIYDSNNNEDVISLLKNGGFSFTDIANATNDEFPFMAIEYDYTNVCKLKGLDGATMINQLKSNMRDIMECVIEYAPYCEDYMEIYKEYVSNRIEPTC